MKSASWIRAGLVVAGLLSLAGILASVFPPADIVNHFRIYIFALCVALLVGALASRSVARVCLALGLAGFNLAALLMPLNAAASPIDGGKVIKIISFNVWTNNTSPDRVAAFLLAEQPDVIPLQETPSRLQNVILRRIAETYPHVHACECRNQLLLSKRLWRETGGQTTTEDVLP